LGGIPYTFQEVVEGVVYPTLAGPSLKEYWPALGKKKNQRNPQLLRGSSTPMVGSKYQPNRCKRVVEGVVLRLLTF